MNAPIDIIDFCPYYPPHIGGVEAYASELHEQLLGTGQVASITVIAPRLPVEAAERESFSNGLTVLRYPALELVPNFPLPKFWTGDFRKVLAESKKHTYSITLTHTRFFLSAFIALLYAKSRRIPLVHIEHGSDFVQSGSVVVAKTAWLYDQTFGRIVISKAAKIVAISKAVQDFVKKVYNKDSLIILRGMRNAEIEAVPADQEIRTQYKDDILLTYVGRLIEGKGVLDLLNVVALIGDPRLRVLLIGDGAQRAELETAVKELSIDDKVTFLGFQPHDKTIGIMKISDILVNPSYTEGLPTTVLEAALCGRAILATDVGGTREIIKDGVSGLLVAPRDRKLLEEKLRMLIDNEAQRKALGETAQKSATETFDWKKSSAVFLEVFESVMKAKK